MLNTRNRSKQTPSRRVEEGVKPFEAGALPGGKETNVVDIINNCNVTVMSGSSSREFPVARQKVGDVRKLLKAVLNVADDAIALINGLEVREDSVLAVDDRLEFVRRAGMKGCPCS